MTTDSGPLNPNDIQRLDIAPQQNDRAAHDAKKNVSHRSEVSIPCSTCLLGSILHPDDVIL